MTRAAPRRSDLAPVLSLAGPWRKELRYGVASGVTQQVLFMGSATVAAYAASRAVRGATYNSISLYLLALVILVLPQVRTPWLEAISFQAIANRVEVQLRARIYAQLSRLTPAGLAGRRSGELGYTAFADAGVIQQFYARILPTLLVAAIVPVLALIALAALAWPLAVATLPFLLAAATAPVILHQGDQRGAGALQAERADLSAELVDGIQGLREVVTFGAAQAVLADLDVRAARARRTTARDRRSVAESAVTDAVATAGPLVTLSVGAALVAHRQMPMTFLAPTVILAALAFTPVGRLAGALQSLGQVGAAGRRIFALLDLPAPVTDGDPSREAAMPEGRSDVEFRGLTFRYHSGSPAALTDVSFRVGGGETLALVGPSGAGKSTCVSLLMRFWDPEDGAVLVGGVDIRDLPQSELHRLVGLVSQDIYLFNTTIRENLRLGRPDATDDEIGAAARSALAWEFIAALPDGLDTATGERGVQLSGGQRQRLAIARVLLADPPVLVLDEPVSNLDSETEQAIAAAMSRLRQGRTTIVVAHRLSTIRSADQIVVLDGGAVVEAGTHDALMARGGLFAQLVNTQLR